MTITTVRALGVLVACALVGFPARAGAQTATPDPIELVKEARKLNAAGKQDEAIAPYEKAIKIEPKSFDAQLGLGIALDLRRLPARGATRMCVRTSVSLPRVCP